MVDKLPMFDFAILFCSDKSWKALGFSGWFMFNDIGPTETAVVAVKSRFASVSRMCQDL